MEINQAFAILSRVGDPHAARIITEKYGQMSRFAVWRAVRGLKRGIPVAKIINEKWFYGIPFYTNRHTLDPRPDTETLVESVLHDWREQQNIRILDLGTGTGCVGISIIMNMHGASCVGVDISRRALRVARRNARNMRLCDAFTVLHGTFEKVKTNGAYFDVIVSNPPYIARGDERVNRAARFDPEIALYAENNGLAAYEQIAAHARSYISVHGRLYLEIGAGMSRDVRSIFRASGWKFVRADKDLGGKVRVLVFSL